jgi:hypothetical protein
VIRGLVSRYRNRSVVLVFLGAKAVCLHEYRQAAANKSLSAYLLSSPRSEDGYRLAQFLNPLDGLPE